MYNFLQNSTIFYNWNFKTLNQKSFILSLTCSDLLLLVIKIAEILSLSLFSKLSASFAFTLTMPITSFSSNLKLVKPEGISFKYTFAKALSLKGLPF